MNTKNANIIFFALSAIHLSTIVIGATEYAPYTKVLLIPSLALYYYTQTQEDTRINTVLLALFCSWLGDTFLIFTSISPLYFLLGLGSFFFAHSFYIYTFVKKGEKPPFDSITISIVALAIVNLIFMLSLLLPVLPEAMQIPVIAYGTILTTALSSTLYLRKKLRKEWGILVGGVALFILSDALIAFNRFLPETLNAIPNVSFCIMLTYIAAQALIIKAVIK
jgi:uncharacterized membrane protein YhhN